MTDVDDDRLDDEGGTGMGTEDTTASGRPGDPVADVVDEVRADLAARRRAGELPDLPEGELERHFTGVVEAVDGAVAEQQPVDSSGLVPAAALDTWRPGGGVRNRIVGAVLYPLSRLVGAVVRRQVGAFSRRSAEVLVEVVDRQNRMQRFLARAHLDRLRVAEYRIAQLEREVEALRDRTGGGG